jgi:hypothetical protein
MYFPHTRGRISIHSSYQLWYLSPRGIPFISVSANNSSLSRKRQLHLLRWGGFSLLWDGLTLHSSFFVCVLHLATQEISSPGGRDSGWSREHIITIPIRSDTVIPNESDTKNKTDKRGSWSVERNINILTFKVVPALDLWSISRRLVQGHPYLVNNII